MKLRKKYYLISHHTLWYHTDGMCSLQPREQLEGVSQFQRFFVPPKSTISPIFGETKVLERPRRSNWLFDTRTDATESLGMSKPFQTSQTIYI